MMNDVRSFAAGLGLLGLCALGASAELPYDYPGYTKTETPAKNPETAIRNWPGRSRSAARVMISKYGEPSRFDRNRLVWDKNAPWRKTVVDRKAPRSFMGRRGADVLEQSIAYAVPDGKIAELKRFDSRITFDKASGLLSSRSKSENLNYLALNLADEIVTGKRSAAQARAFYDKTTKLAESGKSSAYMDGFVFPLVGGPMPNPER